MSSSIRTRLDTSARTIKILEQVFPPDSIVEMIYVYLPTIADLTEWTSATNEMLDQVDALLTSSRESFEKSLVEEPDNIVEGMTLEVFDADADRIRAMLDIVRNRMSL